jgi:adenylate cyclase
MFSDIAGFTSMSERLSPEALISVLAEYLEVMSACIEDTGGTVGKFIGDAIMAFWNSPDRLDDHQCMACAAALRQQERLAALRVKWAGEGYPPVHMRLGLTCGVVLHGNVGSRRRMEWTCAPLFSQP